MDLGNEKHYQEPKCVVGKYVTIDGEKHEQCCTCGYTALSIYGHQCEPRVNKYKAVEYTAPPPIETTPTGGKQAKEPYNYDLLPREAIHLICLNMTKGAETYGVGNYLDLTISTNASRAEAHMRFATMTEDERNRYSDEDILTHLVHGATRALFALDCYLRGRAK